MESKARDYFKRAANIAPEVRWFLELSRLSLENDIVSQTDTRLVRVIEGLEAQLIKLGTANDRKFEAEVKTIFDNLNLDGKSQEKGVAQLINDGSNSKEAETSEHADGKEQNHPTDKCSQENTKKFEDAHERLGKLLGYDSGNSTAQSAPDPWWMAGENLCIVFEDHSGANRETTLGANKVRQAASHPKWIRENENISLSQLADIIPVLVTPCIKIEPDAKPYTEDVCYWNIEEFRNWATNAISIVRELRRSLPVEANLDWRKRAIQAYQDAGIDPSSLLAKLRQSKLRDLSSD